MTTIRDVAKLAEVSVATVSAVMNKDSGVKVSEKLTTKVEDAISELNYVPNRIARSLSRKENYTLGYIVPSITNEFFPQLAKAVEDIAFERNYGVYLCNTEGKGKRAKYYLDSLIENRVAGIITTLTWEIEEINFIENVLSQNIPIVGLAGARSNIKIDTVKPDDQEGARIAVNHLIDKGYKNIAFLGIKNSQTTKLRLNGYKQALLESKIKYNKGLIELSESFSNNETKNMLKKIVKDCPEMDAVFVFNDVMGAEVLGTLHELGKKIKDDIGLVAFDNSIGSYTIPKMTTMSIPKTEMANIAMETLFGRINGNKSNPIDIKITPELIERETT